MDIKHVYWVALVTVLAAWFSNSTIKLPPSAPPVITTAKIVEVHKDLSIFGVKQGQWIAGGKCNIEHINGALMTTAMYKFKRDTQLSLVGWAMDAEKTRLPESVIIQFSGKDSINYFALANIGLERTDVRDYFSVAGDLVYSGYKTNIDLNGLPVGEYRLTIIMKFIGETYICDNNRTLLVH